MNYFILSLFVIIIFISLQKNIEKFICTDIKLLKNLNIGNSKISAFKIIEKDSYINTNLITTNKNINRIIKSIKTVKPKYKYFEHKSYSNNYYSITGYKVNKVQIANYIIRVFNYIKPKILEKSKLFNYKLCNKYTHCNLYLQDKRVKMIGYSKSGNIIIEGQLLVKYNISSYSFLLDFVVSNENNLSLHYLKLKGINLVNKLKSYNYSFGSFITNKNPKIITKDVINYRKKNRNPDEIYKFSYSCFGRKAVNKANCENIYFKTNEPKNIIGVWDKKCQKDTECPFFKANKNYPNNFGKCNNGNCELPLGAIRISPRKFKINSVLMCHNCKKGTNCCNKQKDKRLYPNLKSPDYMFLGDSNLRNNL